MGLTEREHALVQQAGDLISRRADKHSVAAAILTESGEIFHGVDLFHFSGTSCAEIIALGRAMTDSSAAPVLVVAVRKGGKGVVSPCGRCRQFFWDYFPDIGFIVPTADGLAKAWLSELLPIP
jgi:cytidine deaminase